MNKRNLLIIISLLIAVTVIESTVLRILLKDFIIPDLGLIIIIFYANSKGSMSGQLGGFAAGLTEDFISLSPLGFNCAIKTVIGFIAGITRNKIYIAPILFPVLLVVIGTLFKGFASVIISSVFLETGTSPPVFSSGFGMEIILNAVVSPFIFALMKLFKLYKIDDRGI